MKLPNTAGHHAPDQQLLVGRDGDNGVAGISRAELDQPALLEEAFDGQLAVQDRDDDIVVLRLQRAVHDQEVTIVQSGALHGVAGQADIERGGWVMDQELMKVEVAVQVIVGGRRESSRDLRQKQWAGQR